MEVLDPGTQAAGPIITYGAMSKRSLHQIVQVLHLVLYKYILGYKPERNVCSYSDMINKKNLNIDLER